MSAQTRDNRIRVLLADDSDPIRKAVRMLMDDDAEIQVVADATNKTELFYFLRETNPDVLVVDLHLCADPDAMPEVRKTLDLGLVVMSALVGPESMALASNLGIRGLLEKAELPNTLVSAVKRAYSKHPIRAARTAIAS